MEDDSEKQNVEEDLSRKPISTIFNDCSFFQSFWVRCGSIWTDIVDRKFMESQLRVVLYCGLFFWGIYLLYEAIK